MDKFVKYLFILYLFILPFQTRYIYREALLNGGVWEYGTRSLYATEIIFLAIILFIIIGAVGRLSRQSLPKGTLAKNAKENLKNPLISLPLAFLVWAALSILWSYDKSLAWYRWTILLEGIAVYYLIFSFRSPLEGGKGGVNPQKDAYLNCNQCEKIIGKFPIPLYKKGEICVTAPLIAGALVQSCLAIYQFIAQQIAVNKWIGIAEHLPQIAGSSVVETASGRWLRAYGSLTHPNILAAYLGIGLLLFLIFHWEQGPPLCGIRTLHPKTALNFLKPHPASPCKGEEQNALARFWDGSSIIFLLALAVILTFSRAVWLGLILTGAIFFLQRFSSSRVALAARKRAAKLFRFFLIICFAGIIFILREPILTRIKGTERLEIKSNQERALSYNESFKAIKNNFFLGTGIGNYTLALYNQKPTLQPYDYQPAHNMFLMICAELGIVGLAIFLLFISCVVKYVFKYVFLSPLIFFILFISLFDHYFWTMNFGIILFWVMMGISIKVQSSNSKIKS